MKKEQSALIESIKDYFENASKNIDVEQFKDVTVQSICELRSGSNLNKSEISSNGAYPVFGGNGVIGYYKEANRFSSSIVVGKVGMYCGNIHLSSKPYWLTSNAISLEVKNETEVFKPYLAHVLQSMDLNKMATGVAQKFISIKQLNNTVVSLPNYEKQVELSNWFTLLKENKESIQSLLLNFNKNLELLTDNSILEKALKY